MNAWMLMCAITAMPVPEKPAEYAFDLREEIVYSTVGERKLLLDAFVPRVDSRMPAVLVVHGGAWRSGNRRQLHAYATELAKRGMACFAIDYRLAPQHKWPAQIEDCRAAVQWIRNHAAEYNVDPTRLGAIGYSAGGHLVSLLGVTGNDSTQQDAGTDLRLQAVAAGGAPTDFRWFPDNGKWAEYWMGGDLKTVPERFREASAPVYVDKDDPPFFFFNGDTDKLVPVVWTMACHTALQRAGVESELHVVNGANHLQAARNEEALQKAYDFLQERLQSPQPAR
jgi:acetyl esterase/lipase